MTVMANFSAALTNASSFLKVARHAREKFLRDHFFPSSKERAGLRRRHVLAHLLCLTLGNFQALATDAGVNFTRATVAVTLDLAEWDELVASVADFGTGLAASEIID